ncbi:MAG: PIN domain-containing protein, partial [Firmicutes bacterium]|nr:PIN domain-containing protein [Bacillota bacterium]
VNMNLLIDANVVIDVLEMRKPYFSSSKKVCECSELGLVNGFITSLSVANIMYVLHKNLSQGERNNVVRALNIMFNIEETKGSDLVKAADLDWKDFEDAVQYVAAKRIGIDYIVTRNKKDFKLSEIPVLTPTEVLKLI